MSSAQPPQTLVTWLAAVARAQSGRPALIDDGVVWSYYELWQRAEGVARRLTQDFGVTPGDRVGVVGANEAAYIAAYLGIMRAGCVVVPLNAMLDLGAMREQLELVGAAGVIVGDVDPETQEGLAEGFAAWSLSRFASVKQGGRLPRLAPSSPACILLTSGSTGKPKGVVHSQGTLLHAALQMAAALPFERDERNVAFLPFYASIPEQVLPTLCGGGCIDVLPRFDAERVAVAARSATSFNAVPTVMARLLDQARSEDLAGLRWVSFASEVMPVSLLQRWWGALPGVETHQLYGMTELLTVTVANDRGMRREPSTVGAPFPTSQLCVLDENGVEIDDGRSGELVCKSPARMLGYYGDKEATNAAITPNGAMRSGDLARIDEEGMVFLTGRIKDLIISGGLNIAPAEIEAVAVRHPGVSAAAVVGVPDARWGETPVVVVVPTAVNGADAAAVLAHCRAELASFKRPSAAAVVDVLPSTGIGKSAKTAIRQMVLDGEVELVRAG